MKTENFIIKKISKKDLYKAFKIYKKYVNGSAFSRIKKRYESYPELFVGGYDGNKPIGVVFGSIRNSYVVLNCVAVEEKYWRKGIGSRMLKFFEAQVKKLGINKIGVGAADNVWGFYIKNGYKPALLLLKVRKDELPTNYRDLNHKIAEERNYRAVKMIYVAVSSCDLEVKEKIKKELNAYEAIYIFEKHI
jgi:GNAT superfamily N-acetyltransferase